MRYGLVALAACLALTFVGPRAAPDAAGELFAPRNAGALRARALPVRASLDARGGVLATSGVTLVVPPGALAGREDLAIAPVEMPAGLPAGAYPVSPTFELTRTRDASFL